MRLNGTVPRGADLRNALPRRCTTCLALFIVFGKGSARALYCPACRAEKCPSCTGAGGKHYASCSSLKPRPCPGCQTPLVGAPKMDRYCPTCQAAPRCPSCEKVGGGHLSWCTWSQPHRRAGHPGLTEYRGLVTEQVIVELYLEHRSMPSGSPGGLSAPMRRTWSRMSSSTCSSGETTCAPCPVGRTSSRRRETAPSAC
jgi:hypothetical protein